MKNKTLILLILSFYAFLFLPLYPAIAQELQLPSDSDRVPPVIQHQPSEHAAATGKPMTIKAAITDNIAIKETTLYYRPLGNVEYFNVNMTDEGNDVYSATIPADDVIEPGIEYYIQASDKAGNMVLRGFSFSPLTVMVEPILPITEPEKEEPVVTPVTPKPEPVKESPIVETPPVERPVYKTVAKEKVWYKKWWVWSLVGGGAVAIAVAGSLDNDTNKDKSAGGENKGAVTISAPVP